MRNVMNELMYYARIAREELGVTGMVYTALGIVATYAFLFVCAIFSN